MLTEHLKGKSLREVEKMTMGDLLKIIGIEPGPVRIHCATLSLRGCEEGGPGAREEAARRHD